MSLLKDIGLLESSNSTDLRQVAGLLSASGDRLSVVAAELSAEVLRQGDIGSRARETTTHFVWALRSNWHNQLGVYLHEYKTGHALRPGYADTVHDHRYDFVSLLLTGGYVEYRYDLPPRNVEQTLVDSEALLRTYTPGDVIVVANEVFHRVTDIEPGTLTVVLKFAASKETSTSYDLVTGQRMTHVPVESRVPQLISALDSLAKAPSEKR